MEKRIFFEVKIVSSVCCIFHSVRWPLICLSETLALKSRFKAKHGVLKFWSSFVHPGSDGGSLSLEKGIVLNSYDACQLTQQLCVGFPLGNRCCSILFGFFLSFSHDVSKKQERSDPSIPRSTPRCPPEYQTDRLAGAPTEKCENPHGIGATPKIPSSFL